MVAPLTSVCVYCSSSVHISRDYTAPVKKFGELLANENIRLVFGGGRVGLMGVLSDACMAAGGNVLGITTSYLEQYELGNQNITELIKVDTMEERQAKMFAASDAIVMLPGGFGTSAEFFDVLTRKQIGLHNKPIVVGNLYGFWTPMKNLITHMVAENFATKIDKTLCTFVDTVEEILPTLKTLPRTFINPTEKWFDVPHS